MKPISTLIVLIFTLLFITPCRSEIRHRHLSPNNKIELSVHLNNEGELHYAVYYHKKNRITLISPSALGFEIRGQEKLQSGLLITSADTSIEDEYYEMTWGQNKHIRNHYKQLILHVQEKGKLKRRIKITFRIYNDGIAFRYEIPQQSNLSHYAITNELSAFALNFNNTCWWSMADYNTQEQLFHKTKISEAPWVNTPLTIQTSEGIYMSIHEAGLKNYPATTLKQDSAGNGVYHTDLVPWADGDRVKAEGALVTPWRVVMIGGRPGDLVESNLLLNLNDSSKISNASWIKPMKYVGIWWGMHLGTHSWTEGLQHMANTDNAKRYIDFAATHHIDGVVIEGWNKGWDKWGKDSAFDQITPAGDFNLTEVAEYAQKKKIQLIGHHETGGDILWYESVMDSAFALCKKLGIHAVKTGYAGSIRPSGEYHFGQYMVNHFQKVTETAARYEIMLDVHETVKPTGLCRTWPNLMTGEGVRGMEWEAWSEGNPPSHTVLLPFTRGLAGPMDYTPGIFDLLYKNRTSYIKWNGQEKQGMKTRVHSTLAHQLALFITLYSPVQMASDLIENYEQHPAFKFIEEAPTDIEETKVLDADIGKYIITARRSGSTWVIGAVTNEESRTLTINFDFLDKKKRYGMLIVKDAENTHWESNPEAYIIKCETLEKKKPYRLRLAPGGGQAILIKEE